MPARTQDGHHDNCTVKGERIDHRPQSERDAGGADLESARRPEHRDARPSSRADRDTRGNRIAPIGPAGQRERHDAHLARRHQLAPDADRTGHLVHVRGGGASVSGDGGHDLSHRSRNRVNAEADKPSWPRGATTRNTRWYCDEKQRGGRLGSLAERDSISKAVH